MGDIGAHKKENAFHHGQKPSDREFLVKKTREFETMEKKVEKLGEF